VADPAAVDFRVCFGADSEALRTRISHTTLSRGRVWTAVCLWMTAIRIAPGHLEADGPRCSSPKCCYRRCVESPLRSGTGFVGRQGGRFLPLRAGGGRSLQRSGSPRANGTSRYRHEPSPVGLLSTPLRAAFASSFVPWRQRGTIGALKKAAQSEGVVFALRC
jgi:hypothetical protein